MKQDINHLKMNRHRTFLLVMPLLTLPFLTLLFWALGGGQLAQAKSDSPALGLNSQLPTVNLKDQEFLDKMAYYEQAQADSAQWQGLMDDDPNYKLLSFESPLLEDSAQDTPLIATRIRSNYAPKSSKSRANFEQDQVYQKIAQVEQTLGQAEQQAAKPSTKPLANSTENRASQAAEINQLEALMKESNQPENQDKELVQLDGMLEKILDIQHPERVNEALRKASLEDKDQVFAVERTVNRLPISTLAAPLSGAIGNQRFYSLDGPEVAPDFNAKKGLQAVIHGTQELVKGSIVKLRLLHPVYVNGVLIPENQFLFGIAALNGERLTIKITSIRYQNTLYPVQLNVYDIDGLPGIYIPGAIGRNVAKQSSEQTLQSIGNTAYDPSLLAQASGAGVQAAKSLFIKKVKLIQVTVKAGYSVLLVDKKAN